MTMTNYAGITNESTWSHHCHWGTKFSADRCDFKGGVKVEKPRGLSDEKFLLDQAEHIGYHAMNVWPHLNGFSGYDCTQYTVVEVD